ncbi:MAG: ATP-binding protein [Anaeroplasmataceae bacterium]|nr:ATP-binding protein [Anaeroplasmataceae bacterium]
MINLKSLNSLKENYQLKAKTAKGGFPPSIWRTYSSFANTKGGTILLGVSKKEDCSLTPIGLTKNEVLDLQKKFWDNIKDTKIVSSNILTDKDVRIEQIDSSFILVIEIPEASRQQKPIYINDNVWNAYQRFFIGDYKMTKSEVFEMIRDSN